MVCDIDGEVVEIVEEMELVEIGCKDCVIGGEQGMIGMKSQLIVDVGFMDSLA